MEFAAYLAAQLAPRTLKIHFGIIQLHLCGLKREISFAVHFLIADVAFQVLSVSEC